MIHLLVIVPYPELMEKVCNILESALYKDRMYATIQLVTVDKAEQINPTGYDLIIARGYTVQALSSQHAIPVLPLPITCFDVLRAIADCRKKFTPEPKKICLIGQFDDFHSFSGLSSLINVPVQIILNEDHTKIEESITKAVESGCDAIVGGYSVWLAAQKRGIPAISIQTGEEALYSAFDEAIRLIEMSRAHQLRNEMYSTVIQSSHEAILYVNDQEEIIVENPTALALTRLKRLKSRKLQYVLPYMYSSYCKVMENGEEIIGEIHQSAEQIITINYSPVHVNGRMTGVLIFFQDITRVQRMEATIRKKLSEKGLQAKYTFESIIHQSEIMEQTIEKARSFAATSSNIMLLGESGTGKELFAQSIHNCSPRRNGPFVAINCAALPENLLESELFGYVQGAFTGTNKGGKIGLFEVAHGGTLFLDEVSEVSINVQSKLLRVLQEREIRRIGDDKVISVDVRIICATNCNLKKLVAEGRFRQDLMYRLDVLRVFLPPLRQRGLDVLLIFQNMLQSYSHNYTGFLPDLTPEAQSLLLSSPFYGNVRELRNIVERVSVLHPTSDPITAEELASALSPEDVDIDFTPHQPQGVPTAAYSNDSEYQRILQALHRCGGNQSKAARELGIDRSTLWRKLKKYQK